MLSYKVYASDVDFWDVEPSDLEQMEAEELYPPRFVIDVCGTQAQSTGQVWINFSGMENEFKSELILDANRGKHTGNQYYSCGIMMIYFIGPHQYSHCSASLGRQSRSEPVLPSQVCTACKASIIPRPYSWLFSVPIYAEMIRESGDKAI